MRRKNFTREFKQEAIELASRIGVSEAADKLGVGLSTLQKWKSASSAPEKTEAPDDLEKENKRLRKENEYLRKINEVLKKSTAIFSQDHHPNSKL